MIDVRDWLGNFRYLFSLSAKGIWQGATKDVKEPEVSQMEVRFAYRSCSMLDSRLQPLYTHYTGNGKTAVNTPCSTPLSAFKCIMEIRKRRIYRQKWGCEFSYKNASDFSKIIEIKHGKSVLALGLLKQLVDVALTAYRGFWSNASTCAVSCPDYIFGPIEPHLDIEALNNATKMTLLQYRGRNIKFLCTVDSLDFLLISNMNQLDSPIQRISSSGSVVANSTPDSESCCITSKDVLLKQWYPIGAAQTLTQHIATSYSEFLSRPKVNSVGSSIQSDTLFEMEWLQMNYAATVIEDPDVYAKTMSRDNWMADLIRVRLTFWLTLIPGAIFDVDNLTGDEPIILVLTSDHVQVDYDIKELYLETELLLPEDHDLSFEARIDGTFMRIDGQKIRCGSLFAYLK